MGVQHPCPDLYTLGCTVMGTLAVCSLQLCDDALIVIQINCSY